MEYYSAFKIKIILWQHGRTFEDITLSEIMSVQKDKYGRIPIIWGVWSSKTHRNKEQNGGYQELEVAGMESSYLMAEEFNGKWKCSTDLVYNDVNLPKASQLCI